MNVGYARVSTSSQNLENQINQLKSVGCKKIFSEKRSGKNESNREQFKIMMDFVREGDVLYITKLDRLARSVIDLHNIAKFLQNKDVNLKVLHQNIDTITPNGAQNSEKSFPEPLVSRTVFNNRKIVPQRIGLMNILQKIQVVELVGKEVNS